MKLTEIVMALTLAAATATSEDRPVITRTFTTNSNIAVEFRVPNDKRWYGLVRSPSLQPQAWTNVSGYVYGNGGKYRLYDNSAVTNGMPQKFYMIRERR